MEKIINASSSKSGSYVGNYKIEGTLDEGSKLILNIDGFVTLDKVKLNGGLLQVRTPFPITIGDIENKDGGTILIDADEITLPKLDYEDNIYIAAKGLSFTRWNSVKLSNVGASYITFNEDGLLNVHDLKKIEQVQYKKR